MIESLSELSHWLTLRATVEPNQVRPSGQARLVVEVDTPPGCHIEAHQPPEPFLVPTVLAVEAEDGVVVGAVRYPPPQRKAFDWSPVELLVYSGSFRLEAPIEIATGAEAGLRTLRAHLRYQGCTPNACLPPNVQSGEAELEILGGGEEG